MAVSLPKLWIVDNVVYNAELGVRSCFFVVFVARSPRNHFKHQNRTDSVLFPGNVAFAGFATLSAFDAQTQEAIWNNRNSGICAFGVVNSHIHTEEPIGTIAPNTIQQKQQKIWDKVLVFVIYRGIVGAGSSSPVGSCLRSGWTISYTTDG